MIVSRRSRLAQVQAEAVAESLRRRNASLQVAFNWIESEGDRTPGQLANAGGKGLFAKSIEIALLEKRGDVAVHSMKDLPVQGTPGLVVAAVPVRADPRDVLVARDGITRIEDLPQGAVVGTAGPRRAAQLLRVRPDLQIRLIRGNVQTRLDKVFESREYDATLLAAAGLSRLGLDEYMVGVIDPQIMLPAAGQGALAVQCRGDDHRTMARCLPMNDPHASEVVQAERQVIDALHGDCHSPIAAYAHRHVAADGKEFVRLRARVISHDGQTMAEADELCDPSKMRKGVTAVVKQLKAQGSHEILKTATRAAG